MGSQAHNQTKIENYNKMNEIRIQKASLWTYWSMLEGLEQEIVFEGERYKLYVERGNEQIPRYGITIYILDDFDIVGILFTFDEGVAHHRYLTVKEIKSLTYQI